MFTDQEPLRLTNGGQIQTREAVTPVLWDGRAGNVWTFVEAGLGAVTKGRWRGGGAGELLSLSAPGARAAQTLHGAGRCSPLMCSPPSAPLQRQHPGKTRARAHPGSLLPRRISSLCGKAGGKGRFSIPVQRRP